MSLSANDRPQRARAFVTPRPTKAQKPFESLEPRMLLSGSGQDTDHHDDLLHVLPQVEYGLTNDDGWSEVSGSLTVADAFNLHSNPGASHTIYLDFNGHTTQNTIWNNSFNGGNAITTPAFDPAGNGASFSDAEATRIYNIWQRVAEDFIPFDVNVTTADPGAAVLSKSGSGDNAWGVRVAIGGSYNDWYGSQAGGVAYVGSFNWSSDSPTYVFSNNLSNSEKYVAEAITHEAGHTLGLSHDGTPTSGYYTGHGSGTTGWAPIMGVGYYKELTQWSRGEYTGASTTQDDLSIITGNNGFGYRADDFGSSTTSAFDLGGGAFDLSGIIERTNDLDFFSFTTSGGLFSVVADTFERGANLDIGLSLFSAAGSLLTSANPLGALGASLSMNLAAGTYYLSVDGVGQGDPASTGYSDYGSLGRYTLTGYTPAAATSVSVSGVTVDENDGTAYVTVSLNQAVNESVSVDFATLSDSAIRGIDFFDASQTLTFAAGQTSMTVAVGLVDDDTVENTEAFTVQLANATGGLLIGQGSAQVTILDNDVPPTPTPSIQIANASASEGNPFKGKKASQPKLTNLTFTINLSNAFDQPVTVDYQTQDGTALAGTDYLAKQGNLTFAAGQTSLTVSVSVIGDSLAEGNETFTLALSNPTNATLASAGATATILDDDNGSDGGGGGGGKPGKGGGRNKAALILESVPSSATHKTTRPAASASPLAAPR